jgi:hypothetical protein
MSICEGDSYCCSSWLNNAEIVKIECKKYDETFLHVFFDQIDYVKIQIIFFFELY